MANVAPSHFMSSILPLLNLQSLLLRQQSLLSAALDTRQKQTQLSKGLVQTFIYLFKSATHLELLPHSHSLFSYFSCTFYHNQPSCCLPPQGQLFSGHPRKPPLPEKNLSQTRDIHSLLPALNSTRGLKNPRPFFQIQEHPTKLVCYKVSPPKSSFWTVSVKPLLYRQCHQAQQAALPYSTAWEPTAYRVKEWLPGFILTCSFSQEPHWLVAMLSYPT